MDGRREELRGPEDAKLDDGRAEYGNDDPDGSDAEDDEDKVPASMSLEK